MIEIESFNEDVTGIKTASPMGDRAIMWVYAYQLSDVVFDAGCGNAIEELRAYAKAHCVKRVYVSHDHEDHIGGCGAFVPEAEVFAGPVTLESVHKPYPLPEFFQFVWGNLTPVPEAKVLDTSSIVVGDATFEVVDLSGHSREMFGFWDPERRWLFSADAVPLPSQKQMAMIDENIPKTIRRMREIQDMNVAVLFDGHRGPIVEPYDHIETRIRYLTDLGTQVRELAAEGKSIPEIKGVLKFPEPWYLPNTEKRFGINHLIRSLLNDSA
jgi:glyoxylase-like metal-dependent hydrolase (beta-lactamase superfamily II)